MADNFKNNEEITGGDELGREILRRTSAWNVPRKLSREEAYHRLRARMDSASREPVAPSRERKISRWMWQAAAFLLILAGVWTLLYKVHSTRITVPRGEHIEYRLPDGSMVTMNAESELSYSPGNFHDKRYLRLQGEAFFQVKKGKSFVVQTKFASIRVLGTSFNIQSRENLFKVSCLTGKVEVKNKMGRVILTPGQSATVRGDVLTGFRDKNVVANTGWREGEFNFENVPLEEVFKELERQFNVTFTLPDIHQKHYTGGFSNRNLVDALDVVCIPMGLNYEIGSNSKIQITGKTD